MKKSTIALGITSVLGIVGSTISLALNHKTNKQLKQQKYIHDELLSNVSMLSNTLDAEHENTEDEIYNIHNLIYDIVENGGDNIHFEEYGESEDNQNE